MLKMIRHTSSTTTTTTTTTPSTLKLLLCGPQIQFTRPQIGFLPHQLQIHLADRLGRNLLATLHLRRSTIRHDRPISNRMHDVQTLLAQLARHGLRELSHAGARCAVSGEIRVTFQGSCDTCEDQSAFFPRAIGEGGFAVVGEEAVCGELAEGEGAADVGLQVLGEVLVRFLVVRDAAGCFDVVDCGGEFEVLEGRVFGDLLEGLGEVGGVGVGDETFGDGAGALGFQVCDKVGETFLPACEEGNGEVALLGVGEGARDAVALGEKLGSDIVRVWGK